MRPALQKDRARIIGIYASYHVQILADRIERALLILQCETGLPLVREEQIAAGEVENVAPTYIRRLRVGRRQNIRAEPLEILRDPLGSKYAVAEVGHDDRVRGRHRPAVRDDRVRIVWVSGGRMKLRDLHALDDDSLLHRLAGRRQRDLRARRLTLGRPNSRPPDPFP